MSSLKAENHGTHYILNIQIFDKTVKGRNFFDREFGALPEEVYQNVKIYLQSKRVRPLQLKFQ